MKTLFPLLLSITLLAACNTGATKQETVVTDATAVTSVSTAPQTCGDAASESKIAQALSMEILAGMTKEEVKEWKAAKEKPLPGLTDFQLDTIYDEHCILSVSALMEYVGAYPSSWRRYVNVNKRTGNQLLAKEIFDTARLANLVVVCNDTLKKNIAEGRIAVEHENLESYDELVREKGPFNNEDLNIFYITDASIIFEYDFEFPHVMAGLQPSGSIEFTKAELKNYINPSGPLAKWVQ